MVFRRHFKFVATSVMGPVHNNHLFPPSLLDSTFSVWHDKGIKHFSNLYINDVFTSFSPLLSTYDLPATHLFRYFQIRHFVSKCFPNFPASPPRQPWEELLTFIPHHRAMISKMYYHITRCIMPYHSASIYLLKPGMHGKRNLAFNEWVRSGGKKL